MPAPLNEREPAESLSSSNGGKTCGRAQVAEEGSFCGQASLCDVPPQAAPKQVHLLRRQRSLSSRGAPARAQGYKHVPFHAPKLQLRQYQHYLDHSITPFSPKPKSQFQKTGVLHPNYEPYNARPP